MVLCKGWVSGKERAPNPMRSEGFSIQHRKREGHFIAKNTSSVVKTFGILSIQAFIEL